MKELFHEGLALITLLGGIYSSQYGDVATQRAADWPMFMHDLHHTGYSPSSAPDSLHLLWKYDTDQRLFGSPVVSNGVIYQVGRGSLFALNAETGDLLWSSALPVVGSTPFVEGDDLYVGTCNGLAALNADTGEILWQVQLADFRCDLEDDLATFLASSPIVLGASVVMCTHRNYEMIETYPSEPDPEGIDRVVCLHRETGALIWEHPFDFGAGYSLAFVDNQIIVNSVDLEALDDKGEKLWSYPDLWAYDSSPVVSHDVLVVVARSRGIITSISLVNHTLLWQHSLGDDVDSTPAVCDTRVIVVTLRGTIAAFHETTGELLWKREHHAKADLSAREILRNAAAGFVSSPAIADGKIYVGLWSGAFLCLDLETGETLWQYKTEGPIVASPAVADERVFIASTDGNVYCFGIDPETSFGMFSIRIVP